MTHCKCLKTPATLFIPPLAAGTIASKIALNSWETGAKVSALFLVSTVGGGILSCIAITHFNNRTEKSPTGLNPKERKEWGAGVSALVCGFLGAYVIHNACVNPISMKDVAIITLSCTLGLYQGLKTEDSHSNFSQHID